MFLLSAKYELFYFENLGLLIIENEIVYKTSK